MTDPHGSDMNDVDGGQTVLSEDATTAPDAGDGLAAETQILRDELSKAHVELAASKRATAEAHERFLRARADLENLRKRSIADTERAREAGVDTAVLPVLRVFDDLGRAITAAEHAGEPGAILPGVQAVRETLERELEALDIRPVGAAGDAFDPSLHEALSIVPLRPGAQAGVIAEVFEVGFRRGDRLIRPARVVVYSDHA